MLLTHTQALLGTPCWKDWGFLAHCWWNLLIKAFSLWHLWSAVTIYLQDWRTNNVLPEFIWFYLIFWELPNELGLWSRQKSFDFFKSIYLDLVSLCFGLNSLLSIVILKQMQATFLGKLILIHILKPGLTVKMPLLWKIFKWISIKTNVPG